MSIPAPYPLGMIVCDAIWTDPTTSKRTILGMFSSLHTGGFPCQIPHMAVHVSLTDARGAVPVRIVFIDVDESRPPIFEKETMVEFTDPRMVAEISFQFGGVVFHEPGDYRLQLFAAGEFLMERRLVVSPISQE